MSDPATMDPNHTGEIVAKVAMAGGSAGAVVFGLTANEFAAFAGVAIGVAGLVTQIVYTIRRDRREERAAKER